MDRMVRSPRVHLIMYTIMHLIVDLSCIFYLYGMVYMMLGNAGQRMNYTILYNMLAFALPMLLGLLADLAGFNAFTSCLGCFLILLAYLLIPSPLAAVVLIGTGNGLFHIGGGRQVLEDSPVRYAPAGIFISSGALGVFLGRKLADAFRQAVLVLLGALLAVSVLVLLFCGIRQLAVRKRSFAGRQKIGAGMLGISALIFLVVFIRSYYGFAASYSWNTGFFTGLAFTLCVVAGKFTGGIAADRFRVMPASIVSLGGAAILALFSFQSAPAGCVSILLFNMTMPITLTLLAKVWNELPGFAFGTLMMALFLGTLPKMAFHVTWFSSPWGLFSLCVLSLILLTAAEKWMETAEEKK